MTVELAVDAEALREEVRRKYREVVTNLHGSFHFHTGWPLAARLGYDQAIVQMRCQMRPWSHSLASPIRLRCGLWLGASELSMLIRRRLRPLRRRASCRRLRAGGRRRYDR